MTILDWKAIDNADITDMQFTDPPELVPVVPKDGYRARRLLFAIGFCSLLFALELAGGYFSGSLALLSDAFHMLSDVLGYALSYTALCVATRSRSDRFSYGYKRIEVLGALASIMLVWVLTIGLVVEAYGRINSPKEIKALPMLYMSIAGVVVNGILIFVFGHEQDTSQQPLTTTDKNAVDINIRAAMLHAIGDLLCSVGVLLAALIVYFYPQWQIVDPICTLVFGIVAISTTIGILRDIFRVLMQATPDHISLVAVRERIIKVNGVQGVDCKVWALSMGEHVASIQVTVGKSSDMYQLEWIIEQIEQLLRDEFDVTETTIETRMSRD